MARTRTSGTKNVRIQIAQPAPITRRNRRRSSVSRIARRAAPKARSAARSVGRAAIASKHQMYAVGSAAVLGYAIKSGWKIPTLFNLTPAASAAIGAWAMGYFGKNQTAEHIATGLLSAAVYDKAKGTTPAEYIVGDHDPEQLSGAGVMFDDVEGDYDLDGDDDDLVGDDVYVEE